MTGPQVEVRHEPARLRYAAYVDGQPAGFAAYTPGDAAWTFTHTEVDDRVEGAGVGSALVRGALDDVRRQGLSVLPRCPFVRGWVQRHPDYLDLVPADQRSRYDLPATG